MAKNNLEKNIGYVVEIVKDNPGWYNFRELTKEIMSRHKKESLVSEDVIDAIVKSEHRGLIEKESPIGNVYFDSPRKYVLVNQQQKISYEYSLGKIEKIPGLRRR